jgi:hypothetical protein
LMANAAEPPDGSADAPSGPAPFADLLSGYAVRPQWKVAGVDYFVGSHIVPAL